MCLLKLLSCDKQKQPFGGIIFRLVIRLFSYKYQLSGNMFDIIACINIMLPYKFVPDHYQNRPYFDHKIQSVVFFLFFCFFY